MFIIGILLFITGILMVTITWFIKWNTNIAIIGVYLTFIGLVIIIGVSIGPENIPKTLNLPSK